MLPLWIIDLTCEHEERQSALINSLRQIKNNLKSNVHIAGKLHISRGDDGTLLVTEDEENVETGENTSRSAENAFSDLYDDDAENAATDRSIYEKIDIDDENDDRSESDMKDILEEEDVKRAKRNARVEGTYWYYTRVENTFADNEDFSDTEKSANELYMFQEQIVHAGKQFIHKLRESNCKPYQTISVIVLGDVRERLTKLTFASVAAIIQKEKGRILPHHIHQGMEILGMLFIPCDINTYKVDERARILRTLREIEVQHNVPSVIGYDHMIIYQDVQNRTETAYTILKDKEQADYIIQCLVHLFYASDLTHPLLQAAGGDDTFYLSLGVASMYFDMSIEDERDKALVARQLIRAFRGEGDMDKVQNEFRILREDDLIPEKFLTIGVDLSLDDVDMDAPNPHPVVNFLQQNLKRLYYKLYLRFFPARLMHKIVNTIEDKTNNALMEISTNCRNILKDIEKSILPTICDFIGKVNPNTGGLAMIESALKDMQEDLSKRKERIKEDVIDELWEGRSDEKRFIIESVPKKYRGYFETYHEIYKSDCQANNGANGCETKKRETTKKLCDHLEKEATTLARLVRALFFGIMFVLTISPILDLISPIVIDLGDVKKHAFWWALILFLIPALMQLFSYWRYMVKLDRLIRELKAYFLHDAYARIANRLEMEIVEIYGNLIDLSNEYLNRCKQIATEIHVEPIDEDAPLDFPKSQFNQPLNGGTFDDEEIIPISEIERSRILVNYTPYAVNELDKNHYFQLINTYEDQFKILFMDVTRLDDHKTVYNEMTRERRFVSKKEQEEKRDKQWENNKKRFYRELAKAIGEDMVPRQYPTVGDKILQYRTKTKNPYLLRPLIEYAATNGEVTSSADIEYADIKINNERIRPLAAIFLPANTNPQIDSHHLLYRKCIFITRWRSFNHFSFNRILPREDFDIVSREKLVDEERKKALEKQQIEQDYIKKKISLEEKDEKLRKLDQHDYLREPSSLILWAVCPDDNTNEWFKLFESSDYNYAYEERDKYKAILNVND